MTVGILRISMAVPAESLKEKRSIVKSVIERLRHRYNASVAEVDDLDDPGRATIAVACVSNGSRHTDRQLQTIARAVEEWRLDVELLAVETEMVAL